MKLPRWLMIGLWTSIVLPVLAAAGWWWVTWPERTAVEFVESLDAKRWEHAKAMVGEWPDRKLAIFFAEATNNELDPMGFVVIPRSMLDLLNGCQDFRADGKGYGFRVVRGNVCGLTWAKGPHDGPLLLRNRSDGTNSKGLAQTQRSDTR